MELANFDLLDGHRSPQVGIPRGVNLTRTAFTQKSLELIARAERLAVLG
jgi:hypothetical protein